jgi:hypothetical protein
MSGLTIALIVIGSVLVLGFGGCVVCVAAVGRAGSAASTSGGGSTSGSKSSGSATPVTALQLYNDYQANEVSADNKYKGKSLMVSGTVSSIDKDFLDNIVVSLKTPNEFMDVKARVDDDQKSKAASLSKGQDIKVLCTGSGMIIGSPQLEDCTIQ